MFLNILINLVLKIDKLKKDNCLRSYLIIIPVIKNIL